MRKKFAADLTRLGLRYVQWLVAHRRLSVAAIPDALSRRVNIYRLTTLWDGTHDPALGWDDPRWNQLVARITPLVGTPDFESRALDELTPWFRSTPDPLPERAIGCWSYQPVGEGIADGPGLIGRATNLRKLWAKAKGLLGRPPAPRHAELHFHNACSPDSPFEHRTELVRSLGELVADCRREHPTVSWIWCNSWLNSRDEFVDLFPPAWRQSAEARTRADADRACFGRARLNTDNWWGQFERRDGSFNGRLAARFEASGYQLPYPSRLCHVPLDELERHLATADSQKQAPRC